MLLYASLTDLYGDACDVFCVGRNDSILGHFTCDSQGQKVCLPGYQNVDSNCTECVPAEGCSMGEGTAYKRTLTNKTLNYKQTDVLLLSLTIALFQNSNISN